MVVVIVAAAPAAAVVSYRTISEWPIFCCDVQGLRSDILVTTSYIEVLLTAGSPLFDLYLVERANETFVAEFLADGRYATTLTTSASSASLSSITRNYSRKLLRIFHFSLIMLLIGLLVEWRLFVLGIPTIQLAEVASNLLASDAIGEAIPSTTFELEKR